MIKSIDNMNLDLEIKKVLSVNDITSERNLVLTKKQAIQLIENKNLLLKQLNRFEIYNNVNYLIQNFYKSSFIDCDNYYEIVNALIETFYLYQSEFDNFLNDDEIIDYIKNSFDGVCEGSIEILQDFCLNELKNKLESDKFYE